VTDLYDPLRSLREGHWFKLICGASFQHLPAIRNLVLAYALAGADCVDVAADPAVISIARAALQIAENFVNTDGQGLSHMLGMPWLMVSLNDGDDPHFRKAEFDPTACPPACPRPCENICPAQAIVFEASASTDNSDLASDVTPRNHLLARHASTSESMSGVISDRCYGCGRCLPVCPVQQISTRSYRSTPTAIAPLVLQAGVDALEIHTTVGHLDEFRQLWQTITPWIYDLKLIAISCPDGEGLLDYLWALYDIMSPLPCPLLWQMDGRPMSGDLGIGATRAAVKLGQKVLAAGLPGFIQLAGGTNHHTVPKLKALSLLHPHLLDPPVSLASVGTKQPDAFFKPSPMAYIAGVAYGSYARKLLMPLLNQLEALGLEELEPAWSTTGVISYPPATVAVNQRSISEQRQFNRRSQPFGLEETPDLLWQAVTLAHTLVSQLKVFNSSQRTRLNL
jgi:Fe-S-cluster-containing hydrogenase component 2